MSKPRHKSKITKTVSSESLIELVKHDRECRGVGITETYSIGDYTASSEQISKDSTYQHMPCLPARVSYSLDRKMTGDDVLDKLMENSEILRMIGPEHFLSGKLTIAGGAVVWALNKTDHYGLKDCDIFFTGATKEEAIAIVEDIISKTVEKWAISRNQHALNIEGYGHTQVQVMFRLYNSVSEVIHSLISLHALQLITKAKSITHGCLVIVLQMQST